MHQYPQSPGPEDRPSYAEPRRSRRRMWIGAVAALAVLLAGGGGFAAWKLDWFSGNGEAVSFGKATPPPAAQPQPSGGGARAAEPSGDPD
ncbi:alpha/beta hydrolase, partial [Streptomyces xanthophaeus]